MRYVLVFLAALLAVGCGTRPQIPHVPLDTVIQGGARSEAVPGAWPRASEAHALLTAGRIREAETLLEEGRARHPKDVAVLALTGDIAMARGDFQKARDAYRAALDERPKTPALFLRLYETLLIVDPAQAIPLAEDATKWMSDSPGAWLCLAEACVFDAVLKRLRGPSLQEPLRRARAAVQRCQALGGPGTGDADAALGEIAFLQEQWDQAEDHFEKALRKGVPNYDRATDVASAIALIRFRANDLAGAEEAFQQELKLLLEDDEVDSFRTLPKWELVQYYRQVLLGKALTREALRDREDVYARLRRMGVTEFPESTHTRKLLYDVFDLRQKRSFAPAIALVRDELRPEPPAEALYAAACFYSHEVDEPLYTLMLTVLLGDLEFEAGRRKGAMAAYQQALKLQPGCDVVMRRIGTAQGNPLGRKTLKKTR